MLGLRGMHGDLAGVEVYVTPTQSQMFGRATKPAEAAELVAAEILQIRESIGSAWRGDAIEESWEINNHWVFQVPRSRFVFGVRFEVRGRELRVPGSKLRVPGSVCGSGAHHEPVNV